MEDPPQAGPARRRDQPVAGAPRRDRPARPLATCPRGAPLHGLDRGVPTRCGDDRGQRRGEVPLVPARRGRDRRQGLHLRAPQRRPRRLAVAVVRGGYEYQGQKCSAASRLYVPRSSGPRDRVLGMLSEVRVGDPTDFSTSSAPSSTAARGAPLRASPPRAPTRLKEVPPAPPTTARASSSSPRFRPRRRPEARPMRDELFGPLVSAFVYDDARYDEALRLCDEGSPHALTAPFFARDRAPSCAADERDAAGNFYVNDKPTGAVVGQQPFGGGRASGTNDKALPRATSCAGSGALDHETFAPTDWRYPSSGSGRNAARIAPGGCLTRGPRAVLPRAMSNPKWPQQPLPARPTHPVALRRDAAAAAGGGFCRDAGDGDPAGGFPGMPGVPRRARRRRREFGAPQQQQGAFGPPGGFGATAARWVRAGAPSGYRAAGGFGQPQQGGFGQPPQGGFGQPPQGRGNHWGGSVRRVRAGGSAASRSRVGSDSRRAGVHADRDAVGGRAAEGNLRPAACQHAGAVVGRKASPASSAWARRRARRVREGRPPQRRAQRRPLAHVQLSHPSRVLRGHHRRHPRTNRAAARRADPGEARPLRRPLPNRFARQGVRRRGRYLQWVDRARPQAGASGSSTASTPSAARRASARRP